ncbi:transposase IS4 [Legionella busanensis]|uniref:Transposase IS4 n=1 Tax=Legionella busanensis TaxID=190655 RepID=A0A378K939_9GAMM|nr:transposase [Legionella busanensis]STX81236.1 transposase IS4 [Legionella busanensis]
MSLDVSGFDQEVRGGEVVIKVADDHRLVHLGQHLPWEALLELARPDLERTERGCYWMGRPLRVRIHLGIYLLQQLFDLTDRVTEQQVRDNAAFRLFCGYGHLRYWHVPDHTKIEAFRSRLSPETQRAIANIISQQAVRLGYANPSELDIDSTVQKANIAYLAITNLLIKVAILASRVGKAMSQHCHDGAALYQVKLSYLKQLALYYFNLKRRGASTEVVSVVLKRLWQDTYASVLAILNHLHELGPLLTEKEIRLRRAVEQLRWRGALLLERLHGHLFEGESTSAILSLHAYEVTCFNKGKLNKTLEFGRAYQLGRIGGNFLFVSPCVSLHMPDAQSLPLVLYTHEGLFGQKTLDSIATDKGYYAYDNEQLLIQMNVTDIYLPRPRRELNAPKETSSFATRLALHNRRAGIEALISHAKSGGQLGRSRMKSDNTTLSAGYACVLGFNLRQLTRYLAGEVRPKNVNLLENETKNGILDNKITNPLAA